MVQGPEAPPRDDEETDSDEEYQRPAAVHTPYTYASWSQLAQQGLDSNPGLGRLRARFGIKKIDWMPFIPDSPSGAQAEAVDAADAATAGPAAAPSLGASTVRTPEVQCSKL